MHGRTKVPTTQEQDEAKRRERETKVESYRKATDRIYAKRSAGELDEEALTLTESVLRPNPEILTLWNYRREVFLKREEDLSNVDYRALLQKELVFLGDCLRVNPKAYGVWLHREWVMLHIPDPDWKQELGLCDLFLKHDERNFHCWDYRRVVIKHAGVPPAKELQFTYKKIASNFSNYSAWHQRSRLLQQVHPTVTQQGVPGATEDEFELLQNAFFTDPGDQSAWFYHRWLLGKASPPLDVLCLLLKKVEDQVVAVFNKPILINGKGDAKVIVNGEQTEWLDCHAPLVPPSWPSQMWVCQLPPLALSSHDTTDVMFESNEVRLAASIQEGCNEGWSVNELCLEWIFEKTAVQADLVQKELEMCKELLDLEPDNKWCILTTLTLSQAVDPIHYYDDIVAAYEKLIREDPHRRGYYEDQKSKFTVQTAMYQFLKQQGGGRVLDLSHKELTHLYSPWLMCLAREVCLEGNSLTSCAGLSGLLSAQEVNLRENKICVVDVELARLSQLTTLSLDGNPLSNLSSLDGLKGSSVRSISLAGTPVLEEEGEAKVVEHLQSLLSSLEVFNGRKL